MILVAHNESPEVEEPVDRAFDFVPPSVAAKRTTVLRGRFLPTTTMRTNQFDPASIETFANPVCVRRLIVEHSFQLLLRHANIHQVLQGIDLRLIRRKREHRQRRPVSVDHQHDFGTLAFFGLANVGAPFLRAKTFRRPSLPPSQSG